MKRLLQELQRALASGEAAVLVTILSRSGSTPRGVGTAMVVCADGTQTGTIGGGAMEARAKQHAMELSSGSTDAIVDLKVHSDGSKETGFNNGMVTVLFRRFYGGSAKAFLDEALEAIEQGTDAWLVCPIRNHTAGETLLVSTAELLRRLHPEQLPKGTALLKGAENWFVEPLYNNPRVLIFGGGHVAQKTAAQLAFLDFRVWVIEQRDAFADPALFPAAERILNVPFEIARADISISARDHAIVMTSAHETDYKVLRWLLDTPADYIGCIGSRRKITYTKEKLLMDGMSLKQMSRIHAPIGLNIGAETPAEIAVSIAAELIAYRNEKETEEV